jgi:hypothetical protein
MSKGECPKCKRVIIEDVESYREKYPDEEEVQCPYCFELIKIK